MYKSLMALMAVLLLGLVAVDAAAPPLTQHKPPLKGSMSSGGRKFSYSSSVYKIGENYHYVYRFRYTGKTKAIVHWTLIDDLSSDWAWVNLIEMSPEQEFTATHVSTSPPVEGARRAVIYNNEQRHWKDLVEMMRERGTKLSVEAGWDAEAALSKSLHTLSIGAGTNTWVPKSMQEAWEKRAKSD